MIWFFKAMLQKSFCLFPKGEELNYFFQKRVRGSFPASEDVFKRLVDSAHFHLNTLKENRDFSCDLPKVKALEFGPGWDLILPLTLKGLGVGEQVLHDVHHHLKIELIQDSIERLYKYFDEGESLPFNPQKPLLSKEDLRRDFGIHYSQGFNTEHIPSESFDLVSTTSVLEHVYEEKLSLFAKECFRVLKRGGVLSCIVDLQDHFAQTDPFISPFFFYRFSDSLWKLLTCPLNYVNRLRSDDLLSIFSEAGFKLTHHEIIRADGKEFKETLPLAKRFKHYDSLALREKVLKFRMSKV